MTNNLSSEQFGRQWESKDSTTGYRKLFHDIEVPDYKAGEPSAIRATAQELGGKRWMINVVHGPFAERDERGSYYRQAGETIYHEGPLSGARAKVTSAAKRSYRDVMRGRSSST